MRGQPHRVPVHGGWRVRRWRSRRCPVSRTKGPHKTRPEWRRAGVSSARGGLSWRLVAASLGQSASALAIRTQFSTQVPPRSRAHTPPTAQTALRMLRRRPRPLATLPRAAMARRPRLGASLQTASMAYYPSTPAAAAASTSPPRPPSPFPTATLTAPPTATPTGQQHAASLRQAPPHTTHTARRGTA